MKNPFPGPQPYRASDRDRFFGRTDTKHKLEGSILANRCITVYGPSGAGKSSLLQAAVFPSLIERHDARLVRVDAWPEGEEPLQWLATAMHVEVGFGELSEGVPAKETVLAAARGAARASPRPLVIYLDQLEQLLYPGRNPAETQPFFDCVEELVDLPIRSVRVVLSLREDYLGRFRDRLRDLRRVTENGFRVGPLSVIELTEAVLLAADAGEPPQSWDADEIRGLMMQVRVPGQEATEDAEAQSAYAQIICRALFQERAQGKIVDATEAEPILRGYLASTLSELDDLRDDAQRLLEDHLVGADGSRTLRTENELARVVPGAALSRILSQLEGAAILRAEEHHGSRYFEIGHDWLAAWVFEQRKERERIAEQKRLEEEQERRLAESREQQRRLRKIAVAAIVVAGLVGAAGISALVARSQAIAAQKDAEEARRTAEAAEKKAAWERDEANDLRVMAGYRALDTLGSTAGAMKLLAAVKKPGERGAWIEYANEALRKNALFVTLRGHRGALRGAFFSPDGKRVLTASDDRTARIWNADGTGAPIVLEGHEAAILYASFAPGSGSEPTRVLTTSADGTARLWSVKNNEATSTLLGGAPGGGQGSGAPTVTSGAWSPDGTRLVVTSIVTKPADPKKPDDKPEEVVIVRLHAASDGAILGEHDAHEGRVHAAVFLDDTHVLTASEDGTARIWDGATNGRVTKVPGHNAPVLFAAVNREKSIVVTTSRDGKARVFDIGEGAALTRRATLEGHTQEVLHAAISVDGKFVATASADRTARVWNIEKPQKKGEETVLAGHEGPVAFVSFRGSDPRFVATASSDRRGRVFHVDTPDEPLVLEGHTAPVRSIEWNPAGDRLVTAAFDTSRSASADHTARIWSAELLDRSPRRRARSTAVGEAPSGKFHVAAFAAGTSLFAAAFDDSTVELRDDRGEREPIVFRAPSSERWGFVSAAVPSPDGARVAIASFGDESADGAGTAAQGGPSHPGRALYVFDRDHLDKPMQRYETAAAVRALSWSAAGDRIAAGLEDGTALVFRAGSDAAPVVHPGHTGWLTSSSFGPDGKRIVTTSLDRTALVFEADGQPAPIARFEHPDVVYSAAFDPTGNRVATACADGYVRIFEIGGAGPPAMLDGKGTPLHGVVWSPDGARIAASSPSGTILVWSGIVFPLPGELRSFTLDVGDPAAALAFVDGGHVLVAAAGDRAYSWELDIARLSAELQTRNHDCLGVEERILYLNEAPTEAADGFRECEVAEQRARPSEKAKPAELGDLIVARVNVFPGNTGIEVDGAPASRRDGLLELWGKPGEKKKVRVIDGARSTEVVVLIEPSGAKPSVIVLEDDRASGRGDGGNSEKRLGEGDWDALVPTEFE